MTIDRHVILQATKNNYFADNDKAQKAPKSDSDYKPEQLENMKKSNRRRDIEERLATKLAQETDASEMLWL